MKQAVPPLAIVAGDEESGVGGISLHSGGRGGGDVSTKGQQHETERHDIYASRPNRAHMGNKVRKR